MCEPLILSIHFRITDDIDLSLQNTYMETMTLLSCLLERLVVALFKKLKCAHEWCASCFALFDTLLMLYGLG